jgi:hypothetical protein
MTSHKTPKDPQAREPFGYDSSGHMNPRHARHLLELARGNRTPAGEAFVNEAFTRDDLAEELAEAAVTSMTTGEDELGQALDAEVEEEWGGPFTHSSGSVEFANGTDESNTEDATREPFPIATGRKGD